MEEHNNHQVRIHIDQHPYHSATPTTGEALYRLAGVAQGFEIYREVEGDREDQPVSNGLEEVHLHEDAHFHTGPAHHVEITIIVNTEKHVIKGREVSYAEVVALAYPIPPVPPPGKQVDYTVVYRHGPPMNPSGTMLENTSLEVKERMIFDVTPTFRS